MFIFAPSLVLLLVSSTALSAPLPMFTHELSSSTPSRPGHREQRYPAPEAGRPPTQKGSIVLGDAKLDDNTALHTMLHDGTYSDVNVILSGIQDKDAAHGSMIDFHHRMNKDGLPTAANMIVFAGENPLVKAAPHEQFFQGQAIATPRFSEKSLKEQLEKGKYDKVDVWHMAPTFHKDLHTVLKAVAASNKKVDLFSSTIGYNNLQAPEGSHTGPAELEHVKAIAPMVHSKNPNARVVLLQTKNTFGNSYGGTQPLSWAETKLPPNHLDAGGKNETFHLLQLAEADKVIKANGMGNEIEPLPGSNEGLDQLQRNIWAARYKADRRGYALSLLFAKATQKRITLLSQIFGTDKNILINRLKSVLEGFQGPCQAELCDANHYAVVSDAHHNHPYKFVPATVKGDRPNIEVAGRDDPVYGQTLINETADHAQNILNRVFQDLPSKK